MGIKVAFAGKGGVGKTTLAALFIKVLSKNSKEVLAVDCDPVATLGRFLGIADSDKIVPIVEMKELINERMELSPDKTFYKLNPKVDDIPDRFAKKIGNVKLIVMGTVKQGGSGCMCPESGFLKALLGRLLLEKEESIVMDMEAGIEHLGRATAGFVDSLFIVTEPNISSIDAAKKISHLAFDLKIRNVSVILNKVRNNSEVDFVKEKVLPLPLIGSISFDERIFNFGMDENINIEKTVAYSSICEIRNKIQTVLTKN
ncbi:MAG: carbon monoxide dehydrogenase [Candidatus Omnitrophica bacterium]|nr:carbon monoxide dehydrogenase [Candidatus Omnitrophota bacterium]